MTRDEIDRLWRESYVNGMLPFEQIYPFAERVVAAALKKSKALLARVERQMTADFRQIDGEWGDGKADIRTQDSERAATIRDVRTFLKESK